MTTRDEDFKGIHHLFWAFYHAQGTTDALDNAQCYCEALDIFSQKHGVQCREIRLTFAMHAHLGSVVQGGPGLFDHAVLERYGPLCQRMGHWLAISAPGLALASGSQGIHRMQWFRAAKAVLPGKDHERAIVGQKMLWLIGIDLGTAIELANIAQMFDTCALPYASLSAQLHDALESWRAAMLVYPASMQGGHRRIHEHYAKVLQPLVEMDARLGVRAPSPA